MTDPEKPVKKVHSKSKKRVKKLTNTLYYMITARNLKYLDIEIVDKCRNIDVVQRFKSDSSFAKFPTIQSLNGTVSGFYRAKILKQSRAFDCLSTIFERDEG